MGKKRREKPLQTIITFNFILWSGLVLRLFPSKALKLDKANNFETKFGIHSISEKKVLIATQLSKTEGI